MGDHKETQQVEETHSAVNAAEAPPAKFPFVKPALPETGTELSDDALEEVVGGNYTAKNFKSPFD